ncbi:septal ring lytic transglycosylase RlpA family protein [Spirulina sp. CS-785/01]|uniref:septal ring lytic transglycosylase RlpA family protein n=1 Tax=Spirulina sp. CS-785/01 TaxID=3021716 RepID=UPI00232FB4B4|nr:septal ring lytic transglycosylase RlpA family protein [Spirulina sp. CS-785/01]MDB9315866.1 septal ring lytic transglycosylase RlpA family protein [Spirulina sp. CS-785/01]
MNRQLWSGFTTTVLTTALSATVLTLGAVAEPPMMAESSLSPESKSAESHAAEPSQDTARSEEINTTETAATSTVSTSITSIFPHRSDSSSAATVYIHNLPLITFLGSPETQYQDLGFLTAEEIRQGRLPDVQQSEEDPVWRAVLLSEAIDQLSVEEAADITAAWDSDRKTYVIKSGDRELFHFDQKTQLADSTDNWEEDVLHATNRLRRLVGGAPPLKMSEISIRPQATPQNTVATRTAGRGRQQHRGMASWYGPGFHGRRSASGERFNQNALTAAHRTLPFGTRVRVTNLNNGRSTVVRINDRGPFTGGRIIDLSRGAASNIGMIGSGVAPVRLEILGR